jgi:hypothetical protein
MQCISTVHIAQIQMTHDCLLVSVILHNTSDHVSMHVVVGGEEF